MISTTKWLAAVGCAAIAAAGACKKRERAPAEEPIVVSSAREDTARAEAAEESAEAADRWLEQRVEQGLVDVPGLSAMARAVDVRVEGGVVTVRGPILNDQERALVEAIAIANAGDGNVTSQLILDPAGRGWAPGGGAAQPQPQEPAPPPEEAYVESAPPPPMPEYAQTYQGPTPPPPPMAQPGPMGITTPGTVDTGGLPATSWDAAPPGYYSSYGGYGVPLVVPVAPDFIPTTPLVQGSTNITQPGLAVPGEQFIVPGSTGITQGTTAPSSTGISPGSVRMTPTIPGPTGTTQPGVVTQPTPTPFNSTISPTNPGMNTPTTVNPAQMGPGTGNTGVAPALTPPPPSRPVVVRQLNR